MGAYCYTDALQLALEARVRSFGLFHHNQERTDAALDGIIRHCKQIIRNKGTSLECFTIYEGLEIRLQLCTTSDILEDGLLHAGQAVHKWGL